MNVSSVKLDIIWMEFVEGVNLGVSSVRMPIHVMSVFRML